ncbi:MAG: 50S ribosomal protein L37ae [archaeon]
MATKLKSASRFGSRYGSSLKKIVASIEEKKSSRYVCPKCEKKGVKRVSYAMWECTKCGYFFAGGAWSPKTELGELIERIVEGKEKINIEELVKSKEETHEESKESIKGE